MKWEQEVRVRARSNWSTKRCKEPDDDMALRDLEDKNLVHPSPHDPSAGPAANCTGPGCFKRPKLAGVPDQRLDESPSPQP